MTYFLIGSAILFWIVVVWTLIPKIWQKMPKKWTFHPSVYAFMRWLTGKHTGYSLTIKTKLGMMPPRPPEFLKSLRSIKYNQMKALRDVYNKVDQLPTVQKGKQALGLKNMFEVEHTPIFTLKSPYSHIMQRPMFYIPGAPAITFYDKNEFEWVKPLEEGFPIIKGELLNLLEQKGAGFQRYQAEDRRFIQGWNTFNFFFFGKKFEENCALCPETTKLLESLPRFEKDHIMFSALNPRSHIPPHFGPMNGILRVHLPLIVPDGCYLKVGPDIRKVVEGKTMVFDDSFLHEAWNHSDELRIVLFLNFWHPCFGKEEIPVLEEFRRAYELHPLAQLHAQAQELQRENDMDLPPDMVPN